MNKRIILTINPIDNDENINTAFYIEKSITLLDIMIIWRDPKNQSDTAHSVSTTERDTYRKNQIFRPIV